MDTLDDKDKIINNLQKQIIDLKAQLEKCTCNNYREATPPLPQIIQREETQSYCCCCTSMPYNNTSTQRQNTTNNDSCCCICCCMNCNDNSGCGDCGHCGDCGDCGDSD